MGVTDINGKPVRVGFPGQVVYGRHEGQPLLIEDRVETTGGYLLLLGPDNQGHEASDHWIIAADLQTAITEAGWAINWFEHLTWLDSLDREIRDQLVLLPGVHEVGLPLSAALRALDQIEVSDIATLGGDAWRRAEDGGRVICDNWYANKEAGEPWRAYVGRSADAARQAIDRIEARWKDAAIAYVLVCGDEAEYEKLPKTSNRVP
jgi:Immunity protein 40